MCHYETQGVTLWSQNGTGMALIVTPGGDDKRHSCAILRPKGHPLGFIMAHSGTPTLSLEETGGPVKVQKARFARASRARAARARRIARFARASRGTKRASRARRPFPHAPLESYRGPVANKTRGQ